MVCGLGGYLQAHSDHASLVLHSVITTQHKDYKRRPKRNVEMYSTCTYVVTHMPAPVLVRVYRLITTALLNVL